MSTDRIVLVSMWTILPINSHRSTGWRVCSGRAAFGLIDGDVAGGLPDGGVTMLGWFTTKGLERRQRRADSRRLYIQKQIEEFYGPLYSLI